MMEVVMAPRKQPTGIDKLSVLNFYHMRRVDVGLTVIYRHYRPDQRLAWFIKSVVEGIAVH